MRMITPSNYIASKSGNAFKWDINWLSSEVHRSFKKLMGVLYIEIFWDEILEYIKAILNR